MTAAQLFNAIFNVSLVLMITTLVASLGIGLTISQIVAPTRRVGRLGATIVVNSVLGPLIAIAVCSVLPLSAEARTGLAIVTIAAAGPAGLKACEFTKRADMAMAVSFTIVLQLINIVAAPVWAKAIVSGATVDVWSIVVDLILLVLVPLAIGLGLRRRYGEHADGWKVDLEKVSNLALVIAIAIGLAINWSLLVSELGTWVIVASILISLTLAASGWIAGLRQGETSVTISMLSAMRFTPIGLVVIATVLNNQGAYLMPALIFALVDTVVPYVIALELGRMASPAHAALSASASSAGGSPAPSRAPAAGGHS